LNNADHRQLETYHGPGKKEHHGYDGPINISDGGFRAKTAEDDFIQAAEGVGVREIQDLQNLEENNGLERWLRYVSPEGKRQDTAHRYLHPKLEDGEHPNLHVLVESKVVRVLFDETKRAIGVEYTPNPEVSCWRTKCIHETLLTSYPVPSSNRFNWTSCQDCEGTKACRCDCRCLWNATCP
jgi:choline dehydrogenase-like flavoprotein